MSRRLVAGAAALGAGLWMAGRLRRGESLEGRTALVTGGSRGLGFLLAERLLDEGCRVAICARDEESLERARRKLSARDGVEVVSYACDVADRERVESVVDEVVGHFGSLDILVNNAAVIRVAPFDALDADDFRRALDITFMGTVHATLAALPHMRAQGGGRIVNITSIGGKVAVPHLLPYDSAKFAAVGFSEGLHAAVAGDGIKVTTVVPGLMRTGSPVNVEYVGRPEQEYAWFAFGDVFRGSSMSGKKAARQIVRALRRGDAEITLTWQARLLRLTHAVSPGGTSRLMGVVSRLLPDVPDSGAVHEARGHQLRGTLPEPLENALDRAAADANQFPDA